MPELGNPFFTIFMNVLTLLALIAGIFFMFVGALGVLRLPDFYTRNHAASKCITLGISGLLVALVLYMAVGVYLPEGELHAPVQEEFAVQIGVPAPVTAVTTKALLVLMFIFVSAPVGAHMLARAAHMAGVKAWRGTLSDELADDRRGRQSPPEPQ